MRTSEVGDERDVSGERERVAGGRTHLARVDEQRLRDAPRHCRVGPHAADDVLPLARVVQRVDVPARQRQLGPEPTGVPKPVAPNLCVGAIVAVAERPYRPCRVDNGGRDAAVRPIHEAVAAVNRSDDSLHAPG